VSDNETLVLGGGCFWCVEAVFKLVQGVVSATPGYAGGTTENPTYREVCRGETGHAEVVRVEFGEVSFLFPSLIGIFPQEDLVEVGTDLRATVLKAPRRGSSAHNSPLFLEAVSPAAALLVQGQKYFGRHPRDCGDFLRERGAEVYKSGDDGCLIAETDGREFRVVAARLEQEEGEP